MVLREPTEKTDASREIRRILRTVTDIDKKINQDLLDLFLIDRLWDIRAQIEPAIHSGSVVLLDRYYLSTAAYQAQDIAATGKIMNDYFNEGRILEPDMLVYLNLPVKEAISRLGNRQNKDVFETESRLAQIAERYTEAIRLFHEKFPAIPVISKEKAMLAEDYDSLARKISVMQAGLN